MKRIVLFLIYKVILKTGLKIFTGSKVIHPENLVYQGPCIIVGNHNSHLDTISIMANLPMSQLIHTHPVAAGDYFGTSPFKARLTRFFVNALLIPRHRPKAGETGPDPIKMMLDMLDSGESLIVFPEGSRGEPEILQRFKRGVGLVLEERPHIPYIPVYMKGMGKVLPKGDPIPVPFDSYMYVGKPVWTNSRTAETIVEEVEKHVLELMAN